MNIRNAPLVLLALVLVVSSCADAPVMPPVSTPRAPGIPFTQQMIDRYRLTDSEIRNLQYYTSSKYTLTRILHSTEKQIGATHKLKMVEGKTIEEVIFERWTPGVATAVFSNALNVSFEDGYFLNFGIPGNYSEIVGYDKDKKTYLLRGDFQKERGFFLEYGGNRYQIETDGDYELLVDAESLDNVIRKRRTVPGRRLDQQP